MQCVRIDGLTSYEIPVHFGVSQGSILGSSLFLIYINDWCPLELPNAKIITFADDTALLFCGESWDEDFHNFQGFNVVNRYLHEKILTLNVDKTKYITFSLKALEATTFTNYNTYNITFM